MTDKDLIDMLKTKQICTGFKPDGHGDVSVVYGPDPVTAEAANRIDALTAQLESTLKDRKLILEERDRTFALMLARAEKAEAEREALEQDNHRWKMECENFWRDREKTLTAERDGLLRCVTDNHVALCRAEKAEAERDGYRKALEGLMVHEPDYSDTLWQDAREALNGETP